MADVPSDLRALRDELVALGAADGTDFAVLGTGDPAGFSSEQVLLRGDEAGWHVEYRDMGRSRELLLAQDLESARARFVDEVLELAGGRGRGPRAVHGPPSVRLSDLRRGQDGA